MQRVAAAFSERTKFETGEYFRNVIFQTYLYVQNVSNYPVSLIFFFFFSFFRNLKTFELFFPPPPRTKKDGGERDTLFFQRNIFL